MAEYDDNLTLHENLKDATNEYIFEAINYACEIMLSYIKTKTDKLPGTIDQLIQSMKTIFSKPEAKQEVANQWEEELSKKGLTSRFESDLPDDVLLHNFHQEGYITGIFAGYFLSMMAMADNNVPKEYVLSVRDQMQPYLTTGLFYEDFEKISDEFNCEKYNWIDKLKDEKEL